MRIFLVTLLVIAFSFKSIFSSPNVGFPDVVYTPVADYGVLYFGSWAAKNGLNPYQSTIEMAFLGQPGYEVSFVSPPWIFFYMLPWFSISDYYASSILWIISSILFYFVSLLLIGRVGSVKKDFPLIVLGFSIFPPFLSHLENFNIGAYLLFLIALSVYFFRKQNKFLAGLFVPALFLKPHLFVISAPFCIYYLAVNKELRFVLGAFCSFLVSSLFVLLKYPNIFSEWVLALNSASIHLHKMRGTNIFSCVSSLFEKYYLSISFPLYLPYFSIMLGVIVCFFLKKIIRDKYTFLSLTLFTSILFAPYAWLHDYVLAVLPFGLLCKTLGKKDLYLMLISFVITSGICEFVPHESISKPITNTVSMILIFCILIYFSARDFKTIEYGGIA